MVGHGSLDLVLVPGFPSNLEILWEDPGYSRLVKRLSAFCRLILFDPSGTGLSDAAGPRVPSDLRESVDSIRAVMDAAGSGRAALLGASDGAAQAIRFVATHPDRARALILYAGYASLQEAGDAKRMRTLAETIEASWGTGNTLARLAPGRAEDRIYTEWWGRLERLSAGPTAAAAVVRASAAIDVRDALPAIAAPTLVLHRTEDAHVGAENSRLLARLIKKARLVELPGRDHPIWLGDVDRVADLAEEFLTGERSIPDGDRVLGVLLVARVVGTSSGVVTGAAGRHMQERMEILQESAPRIITRYGGQAQWSSTDRIDARFDGAARAVSAAVALKETAASIGLALSQGIHAGEIDVSLDVPSGHTLDTAQRIAASARNADILLSRLASELVSGSGLQFVDRGTLPVEGSPLPLSIVGLVSERHLEPLRPAKGGAVALDFLSPREREVLALVADGLSNPLIAVQLGLSEHTVKRHVANILMKLEMPTRAAAAGLLARQPPR